MTLKLGSNSANTQEVAFRFVVVAVGVRKTCTHNWKKTQTQPAVGIAPEIINDVFRAFCDAYRQHRQICGVDLPTFSKSRKRQNTEKSLKTSTKKQNGAPMHIDLARLFYIVLYLMIC
jgi:hypothetical protein